MPERFAAQNSVQAALLAPVLEHHPRCRFAMKENLYGACAHARLDDVVDDAAVQVARHETCADALDLVGPRVAAADHRALCGLHRYDLHNTLSN